jgi:hypothetical protein
MNISTKEVVTDLRAGENGLWEAAEKLAYLVGTRDDRRGGEVVEEILTALPNYSRDKIYRLARAGRCYIFLIHEAEELAERARKELFVSHMEALGSCFERGDCKAAGVIMWCELAIKNNWNVERLRAEMPSRKKFSEGGWNERAKKAIPYIKAIVEDETLGADSKYIHRALRIGKLFVSILERMTQ